MRQETYNVMEYDELQDLIGEFLGKPEYDTLIRDMADWNWGNDSLQKLWIEPKEKRSKDGHNDNLSDTIAAGRPEDIWGIMAIMEEVADQGKIPYGTYLIEICW